MVGFTPFGMAQVTSEGLVKVQDGGDVQIEKMKR
jgi:hypothetical protein